MLYRLLRPLLFLVPAETAHHLAFGALRAATAVPGVRAALESLCRPAPSLSTRLFDLTLPSPIGLAAGFDKDAIGIDALGALGFGFVEVGTLTNLAQPGNPRPRLFRLGKDRALVNRMGFNNHGAERARERLAAPRRTIVGVNVGRSKLVPNEEAARDVAAAASLVAPFADYLVVNVSSPNTPGLRDLQAIEALRPLLERVREAADDATPRRSVPLAVKIAPDLADEDVIRVAELALELGLDGIIATNTTIRRDGLRAPPSRLEAIGAGGLSGAPLRSRSLEVLRILSDAVRGRVTLISAGGIETADDVFARLEAGARVVQMYTGFVYGGPLVVRRIHRELAARLADGGHASLAESLGSPPTLGRPLRELSAPISDPPESLLRAPASIDDPPSIDDPASIDDPPSIDEPPAA